jgi:hypothetical protein
VIGYVPAGLEVVAVDVQTSVPLTLDEVAVWLMTKPAYVAPKVGFGSPTVLTASSAVMLRGAWAIAYQPVLPPLSRWLGSPG